ncbi:TolC family protein [Pleomorphovibrio marinus]|uniref:TolC family protein n=1 Tax=Pleomorphovibrio marinus TaxID=2164132 RepID=UPI000E0B49CE|nr:TolC family protein [Pleomorphovibrio marinus]
MIQTNPKPFLLRRLLLIAWLGTFPILEGLAQVSLKELLEISLEHYPELEAKRLESEAAKSQVAYERTDFVPKLNASYQANYATSNNITGMFLPGQVMPISGPPSIENTNDMVYGSAAALLMHWSPITFGKRSSRIQSAREGQALTDANQELTEFEHQIRFVQAYLEFWEAKSRQVALEKDLERYTFNLKLSRSLVLNGIRPGVDSAQYRTLRAKSSIAVLKAKNETISKAERVKELLGTEDWQQTTDPGLEEVIRVFPHQPSHLHPLLARQQQNTAFAQAEKTRFSRDILPDFLIWGTGFARGSAINFDGTFDRPEDGLSFSRYNYGLGFQISFPLLQFAQNRHQVRKQAYKVAASEAYERQVELAIDKEMAIAMATLENAMEAAQLSPDYVQDADFVYQALQARYDAGLINLSELLQGQFDLASAEAEDIQIRSEMWKALLYYAAVNGNLELFIQFLN